MLFQQEYLHFPSEKRDFNFWFRLRRVRRLTAAAPASRLGAATFLRKNVGLATLLNHCAALLKD